MNGHDSLNSVHAVWQIANVSCPLVSLDSSKPSPEIETRFSNTKLRMIEDSPVPTPAPEAVVAEGSCVCDFCGESPALIHCRADTAKLCLACDRHVHAANTVSSRHHRALLCDSCRAAPATILCASFHRSVLCPNCDFEAHRGGGSLQQHDRRPLESFSGCPPAMELVGVLGVGGDVKELVGGGKEEIGEEGWGWEAPLILSLDDYIVPTTSCHGFQALATLPFNKGRKSACGKHEEEIIRQLRELMKSELYVDTDGVQPDLVTEFLAFEPEQNPEPRNLRSNADYDTSSVVMVPTLEVNYVQWNQSDSHGTATPVDTTDPVAFSLDQWTGISSTMNLSFTEGTVNIHTSTNQANDGGDESGIKENVLPLPCKAGCDMVWPDRDTALSRYKEKRKTRRYDKLIRYESRKARADSRMRIKGRFAKANQT